MSMSELLVALPRALQVTIMRYLKVPQRILIMGGFGAGKSVLRGTLQNNSRKRRASERGGVNDEIVTPIPSPCYAPTLLYEVSGAFQFRRLSRSRGFLNVLNRASALWVVVRVRPGAAGTDIYAAATQWYSAACFPAPKCWHLLLNVAEEELSDNHYAQIAALRAPTVARPAPSSVWAQNFDTCNVDWFQRILDRTIDI